MNTKRKSKAVDYERLYRRQITDEARDLVDSIRQSAGFDELKAAVILFIGEMENHHVIGDEDLLSLTAEAVLDRDKSVEDGLLLFHDALERSVAAAAESK